MQDEVDERYWSASEAQRILRPDMTPRQVREKIRYAGIQERGRRHSASRRGKRAAIYSAEELIRLLAPGPAPEGGWQWSPDPEPGTPEHDAWQDAVSAIPVRPPGRPKGVPNSVPYGSRSPAAAAAASRQEEAEKEKEPRRTPARDRGIGRFREEADDTAARRRRPMMSRQERPAEALPAQAGDDRSSSSSSRRDAGSLQLPAGARPGQALSVSPGDCLAVRVSESWTPSRIRETQELIQRMELPFRVLIIPGQEMIAIRVSEDAARRQERERLKKQKKRQKAARKAILRDLIPAPAAAEITRPVLDHSQDEEAEEGCGDAAQGPAADREIA